MLHRIRPDEVPPALQGTDVLEAHLTPRGTIRYKPSRNLEECLETLRRNREDSGDSVIVEGFAARFTDEIMMILGRTHHAGAPSVDPETLRDELLAAFKEWSAAHGL